MFKRFRYRRKDAETRLKFKETFLNAEDFIWPVFLVEGFKIKEEIASMPDVFHFSIDTLLKELHPLVEAGLKAVLLFHSPNKKGIEQSYSQNGIIQKAIPLIKEKYPKLCVITDVCACSYTNDGHCHIGDNDKTCEILAKIGLSHARAGADIVAPSDMMDGRVFYIHRALSQNGLKNVEIMSYSAKYASSFYGPFRDAIDCAPKSGDRKTYQMDPSNGDEAMEEIAADLEEGANSIIVKPALSYLDIIYRAARAFNSPIIAYNVSGEYSMLKLMIKKGLASESIIEEALLSIKRAGANKIISYFTPYILLGKNNGK